MEDHFSTDWGQGAGDGFKEIQVHYIYCALYFYQYCISSISGHLASNPRGWGLLAYSSSTLGSFVY